MKKQLVNSIEKKVITFSVALFLLFGSYAKTYANPFASASDDKSSYISYKGPKDDYLVFKVDYKNESAQPFQLIIKNEHNEVLYSKAFEAKPLNTDVLLTELPDNSKLTFSIVTKKDNYSQSFAIDSKVKTIEEYVVKGL